MSDFWLIDQIRSRVFVVELPGMTRQNERYLVKSCRRLASTASAAGVPLAVAWSQLGHYIERTAPRIRTEQERETFVAIMQRLRDELFREPRGTRTGHCPVLECRAHAGRIESAHGAALSRCSVPLAGLQVLVDRRGGLAAGTHGKDHGGAAGDDVAASEDAAL